MTGARYALADRELVIATRNPGKVLEIQQILSGLGVRWRSLEDFGEIAEPDETGTTFAENARIKALYYAERTSCLVLADDSGLEVDALDGRPGIESARFAGEQKSDADNNARLIRELRDVPESQRSARFRCVVALAEPGLVLIEAEGCIEGRIVEKPRGTNGFGYDPHFFVPECGATTAELSSDQKSRISHRGRALRALAERLKASG